MAVEAFKRLWRNEYFQTAITFALIVTIVFMFFFASQAILGTEYPAMAVASGSMLPTLNVGDLIIVQRVDPAQINARYITGDIVVYRRPNGDLWVHRAVIIELKSDGYWITTRGDNNPGDDSSWPASALIGKVIARIPYAGNFPLFIHTQENMYVLILLIILVIFFFLMLPSGSSNGERPKEGQLGEKKKLFGKIDISVVYLLILNFLLIGFLVFSLWGGFTFWQPGADPPQPVTIRGMYPDVQYHESFNEGYNNVEDVFLSQGFLTYSINCYVSDGQHEGTRPSPPTFSWTQAAIIVLGILDVRELIKFIKSRKTMVKRTET